MNFKEAMDEIENNSGTQFDPKVVEVFFKIITRKDMRQMMEKELAGNREVVHERSMKVQQLEFQEQSVLERMRQRYNIDMTQLPPPAEPAPPVETGIEATPLPAGAERLCPTATE